MAQKDEPTREWRSDPGAASGGHLASDPEGGESWFEVLNAPLPSEIERREAEQRSASPTETARIREAGPAREPVRRPTPVPGSRRRTGSTRRRVRRTVRRVDPLGVLKISLVLYTVMLVLWLAAVALLFNFLSGLGLFDTLNSALRGFAYDEVDITLGVVERWAFIIGIVFVLVGSIVNVIVAILYNLIANLIGGVEVTFTERDQ